MEKKDGAMDNKVATGSRNKTIAWIIIGTVVVVAIVSSSGNNSNYASSEAATENLPSPIAAACQSFATSSVHTISYKQLEKDSSPFEGDSSSFRGKVLQIQESAGQGYIRLAVVKDEYGYWDPSSVLLVRYEGHTDVLEDDVVTVRGVMEGSQTYTSQANYQITVPLMYSCSVSKS